LGDRLSDSVCEEQEGQPSKYLLRAWLVGNVNVRTKSKTERRRATVNVSETS